MRIVMNVEEIIAAFEENAKIQEMILSYYGINSGDIDSVEVEGSDKRAPITGSEKRRQEYFKATELTERVSEIMAGADDDVDGTNWKIDAVKEIRAATGLGLIECKARLDAWIANRYEGNV